ncbi:MAG: molybdopterin-dependent oxidoreductase, partial [Chloroflexi bacterium]|nr:molybdopterin-dependent oxidoreductase [Chloroflexota bacterium]
MKELSVIGKPLPRIDAVRKVTGEAIYGGDVVLPGMLHGKILRSPFPHARILNVDASRAKRLPGVKAVITGRDTPGIPFGMAVADEQILAIDKARYIGDEIAAVAAIDEDTALEALDLIVVEYEKLPAAFEPEEALKPEAPQIHDDAPGNLAAHLEVDRGDVDRAFEEADCIVEETFVTPVVHQAHLEPSGCVASFDASGNLTVWMSHMRIFGVRLEMAAVLGLPESRINIIRQDCGGAFGGKVTIKSLYPICALLSKAAGRPVRLFNTVEEEFLSGRPRAAATLHLKAGATRDGKLVAKDTGILVNTGAYCNLGPFIMMALSTRTDSLY